MSEPRIFPALAYKEFPAGKRSTWSGRDTGRPESVRAYIGEAPYADIYTYPKTNKFVVFYPELVESHGIFPVHERTFKTLDEAKAHCEKMYIEFQEAVTTPYVP